jgi:integrase/recombinase XerD
VTEIKLFMAWYGERFYLKVPRSRPLPQYTAHEDVEQLLRSISGKKSHKRNIARDRLLVELAYGAGLRRGDLARLLVGDLRIDQRLIIVRRGKGQRDRVVPLTKSLAEKLEAFCHGKRPEESVFGLTDEAITNKIRIWSRKAGVPTLHCHSLRHGFATRLLERGADIRQIQALLGHENLNTTQVYADLVPSRLRDAVELLEQLEHRARGEPVPPAPAASEKPCLDFSWEVMAAGECDPGETLVICYD